MPQSASSNDYVDILRDFGMTTNQAKVYLAIARRSLAPVSYISNESKVRREDVYRIIPKLEKLGLVEKILGTPNKIKALPMEEAFSRLVKREQERINQKTLKLKAQREKLLKHLKVKWSRQPPEQRGNFALVLQRDQVINKAAVLIREAQKEISILTSPELLFRLLPDNTPLLRSALRKGVKLRMIIDMPDTVETLVDVLYPRLQEFKSEIGSFDVRFSDQISGHYIIGDHKQVMIAASTDLSTSINPHLWTDDENLVGILQTTFEETWNSSAADSNIQTSDLSEKVMDFVKELNPRDHVVYFYQSLEAKHDVLFSYLKAGLQNGYSVAYVASEETTSSIRDCMKQFGIEVEKNEKTGALQILDYSDIYIINGRFEIKTTLGKWKDLHNAALKKGFKGLRVTGEMSCFFDHYLLGELVEYEKSLHRVLDLPMTAICAYNTENLAKAKNPIDLYTELVRAHGAVLFAGIDNSLGKIEIRA